MLAHFSILLPFNMAVAKGAQFSIYQYESNGYIVRVVPPSYTGKRAATDPDELKIDGEAAVLADVLRIDFQKDTFDRRQGAELDPPEPLITEAIASFLNRLRHVARAPQVRLPVFPQCSWHIEYRNDDDTPLVRTEGFIRGHFGRSVLSVSCVGLKPGMWTEIHELPADYEPPPWEVLLLDALAELPKVGTAIVLGATALEVFIAAILDKLATYAAPEPIPTGLWTWIKDRDDYRRQPTVNEQYDALLELFTGHTLKDEQALWESFNNLKQARNTFVHEGTARIGKTPVTPQRAQELVVSANAITMKVRDWIPEALRWKTCDHRIRFEFTKGIGIRSTETKPQITDEQHHNPG